MARKQAEYLLIDAIIANDKAYARALLAEFKNSINLEYRGGHFNYEVPEHYEGGGTFLSTLFRRGAPADGIVLVCSFSSLDFSSV